MDRITRFGGLSLSALIAIGCGSGGTKYAPSTVNFDARATDSSSDKNIVVGESPADAPIELAPEAPTDAQVATNATDAATDLKACTYGGAVPIYCSGAEVYEPSPVIACIGGGHVYGTCANGCAVGMIMGPVADPLAVLCGAGTDGATDGDDADVGSEM